MEKRTVKFSINGKEYQVSENESFTPESYLVDYIRDKAGLKGTRYMCREGGCGACVVTARIKNSTVENPIPKAVNSCLAPVFSCDGWDISTVEFLGNKYEGYHPIHDRMVKFGASQCGFCSTGMVMSMYSLMESKSDVRVEDVHNLLDGNICRCTGYRPILDAFKSLAVDAPEHIRQWCSDIEDCVSCPIKHGACSKRNRNYAQENIRMEITGGQRWIKVCDLNSAFREINSLRVSNESYRIVAGNTGHGAFRSSPVKYYLDISCIPELSKYTNDSTARSEIILGSCVTLTKTIEILQSISEKNGDFRYAGQISKHLQRVANVPVRNMGTLGGNLMLKYIHREFQSDVFVLMESVGAKITIASSPTELREYSLLDFLFNVNMDGKLIISLHLPRLSESTYRFNSFKITRRYQNSHAYVNAGILFRVDPKNDFLVMKRARIVYGGISPKFVHANNTEKYFIGKYLQSQGTLFGAMQVMESEVFPNQDPNEPSPFYRKSLAKSLLYKAILKILRDSLSQRVKSGAEEIIHKSSSGKQTFDRNTDKVALYKAIPKREATYEISGEAEYINDMPILPNELFGAFVLSTVANAQLKSVDTSEALKIPGVCRFIDARDIPGPHNYMVFAIFNVVRPESVFISSSGKVEYAGEAIGLILASSNEIAHLAASKVKVSYKNVQKPITRTTDAVDKVDREGSLDKHTLQIFRSKRKSNTIPTHTIKGKWYNGAQYHYHMETQQCVCRPKEDSMEVYSSTQWLDHTQSMIAYALNKPTNYVKLKVKRLGGGFGAKLVRGPLVAIPCAVAAYVTNRPVRVIMDMETNMSLVGKRPPYLSRYQVSFDDSGAIAELKTDIFSDVGFSENEAETMLGVTIFQNVYKANGWTVRAGFVTTNTPGNTSCRAPGKLNCVALIEYIMEHIAFELKKDPLEVRAANFWEKGDLDFIIQTPFATDNPIPNMLSEIKATGDYEQRKRAVKKFNDENRWKKRGLSVSPSAFHVGLKKGQYPVYIAIYHFDASVAVAHGGIEMGQGINTKVIQTVSTYLQCPVDKIIIYPSETLTGNNASFAGGSFCSELCCAAAIGACKILVDRMKPIRDKLGDVSWEEIVAATFEAKIDLSATYMYGPNDNVKEYYTWTVVITEVEVDMLTGEYKVCRVDLLDDVGKSLNPLVDIGQIEGAYVMGQGLWTSEKIIYDEHSGQLLTNRSWNYKPPESKDIPEDFRVTILRNSSNPVGVLRSKAVGEPPICSSVSVLFALKDAINSARKDTGNLQWYQLDGPVTPEDVLTYSLTSSRDFNL